MNSEIQFQPMATAEVALGLMLAGLVVWSLFRMAIGPASANARRWGLFALRATVLIALLAIVLNPVSVREEPGLIDPPEVFYLIDTSSSMSLGSARNRWDESTNLIREAQHQAGDRSPAHLNLFRFGEKLTVLEPGQIGLGESSVKAAIPGDADTQLAGGLRRLTSRFGKSLPAGIFLFSDGRARDSADVEFVARHYAKLSVPIHVVPVGEMSKGGDLAILGAVGPNRVRQFTQVDLQVFLRSFGYEGRRVNVALSALGKDGKIDREITSTPLTIGKGIQSAVLSFQADPKLRKLRVTVEPAVDEISSTNNHFDLTIEIDHTKIRVLYVEGNVAGVPPPPMNDGGHRGPFSLLHDAMRTDAEIECDVLAAFPGVAKLARYGNPTNSLQGLGFPGTKAELAAYDCIIFSNVPKSAFTDDQLNWIENWVSHLGGGFCMAGGPLSFASGGWNEAILQKLLPVELNADGNDYESGTSVAVQPVLSEPVHPLWQFGGDDKRNRDVARSFPPFAAANRTIRAKPGITTVLATTGDSAGAIRPVMTVGRYGNGRSMAIAGPITDPLAGGFTSWGENDRRHYEKFWRNVVYWLSESSLIGRRRLVASSDKIFYRPGETISVSAQAFDEAARESHSYRVVALIEPAAMPGGILSDAPPVQWPDGLQRTSGETGPLVAWGEEIELSKSAETDGYGLKLPIAEASAAVTQALRIELTAYDADLQVDSTSLSVHVIDDPFELQNPFPDHELLARLASLSGGKVIHDAAELAKELKNLPIETATPIIRRTPLWNHWALVIGLIGLLTAEWIWRRLIGMA